MTQPAHSGPDPISAADFLNQYLEGALTSAILADERRLVQRRLAELEQMHQAVVREKEIVAEQSGDNWHDGAFRATDDAARAIGDQAAAVKQANRATTVEMPPHDERRATLGSVVTIRLADYEWRVRLVGLASIHDQLDDPEPCSIEAPIAQAVVGRRSGETVEAMIGGKFQPIEILAVSQLPLEFE